MSLTDSIKGTFQSHNRYQLTVEDCHAPLDVESFIGREAISETYRYQIMFTSPIQNLQAQQILRRTAHFTFSSPTHSLASLAAMNEPQKHIHGIITHFKRLSGSADEAQYQIVIEPFVSLLRYQMRTHRFFLNKSVPEVVEIILREHRLHGWEFEFHLQHQYPKRQQINQIRESDWQFIERLLSEVGIFYSFSLQPDAKTEIIHFGDSQRAYVYDLKLPLNSPSGMNDNGIESVWGLSLRHQVVEKSVTTKDYNHRQATQILQSVETDMTRGEGETINYGNVYHYQARHLTRGDKYQPEVESAHFWSKLDHERFLAGQTILRGKSNASPLVPLMVLSITDNQLPATLPTDFQSDILITRLRFSGSRSSALVIHFTASPYTESLCWRPVLKPRPVIAGTLMARVSSAKTHDIYAHQNEHGFYWVKFDADRDEQSSGYESMPVRLAKPYAGDTYGMHFPLVQGTEVAIGFHEGDPDRPYIAHALHDSYRPDVVTDKNNTRNIIRTPANNKFRMEDLRGQEHIKLSTEYGGKSQLNLGYFVNQQREKRGDGFELRTDSWGAIRAGKGLFISADKQEGAKGEALAMKEAQAQLMTALVEMETLSQSAAHAHAVAADIQHQQISLEKKLLQLKQAVLLGSAPEGIAFTSGDNLQLSARKNITLTASEQIDIGAVKKFTLAAGQMMSFFARMGAKIFAAKGNVEIQAQDGDISTWSTKDTLISSGKKMVISAQDELLLNCGGAFIRLKNGNVEIGGPGKLLVKNSGIQKMAAQNIENAMKSFSPETFDEWFVIRCPLSGEPMSDQAYELTLPDGNVIQGVTDKQGKTSLIDSNAVKDITIKLFRTKTS